MFISIGASLHKLVNWHEIDWKRVNQNVRRLQARIVKALAEMLRPRLVKKALLDA